MSLEESLRDHLRNAGWLAFTEIPLGANRAGNQRADVLAIKKSYRVRIVVYEIKRARGDFFQDVNSGKYEGYWKVAHQVYFAVPAGLIKKNEVPAGCGLTVRNEDTGWHGVKAAKVQELDLNQPRFFELLLACLFRGYDESLRVRNLRERIVIEDNVSLSARAKNIGWTIARRLSSQEPELRRIREAKESIDRFLGEETKSFDDAMFKLNVLVNRRLPGLKNIEMATELLELAGSFAAWRYGSLMHYGAERRLRELVEKVGAQDDQAGEA